MMLALTRSELVQELGRLGGQFADAALGFPNLHHAVLRGNALEDPHLLDYLAKWIAQFGTRSPYSTIPSPPYHFFFGESLEGIRLLRSFAQTAIRICKALDLICEPGSTRPVAVAVPADGLLRRRSLPVPWHFVFNRQEVEHDWVAWIAYLAALSGHPAIDSCSRPLKIHDHDKVAEEARPELPAGEYLMLPTGHPIGRWIDGKDGYHEDKEFKPLLQIVKDGRLGEHTIVCDVFSASRIAVGLLVALADDTLGPGQRAETALVKQVAGRGDGDRPALGVVQVPASVDLGPKGAMIHIKEVWSHFNIPQDRRGGARKVLDRFRVKNLGNRKAFYEDKEGGGSAGTYLYNLEMITPIMTRWLARKPSESRPNRPDRNR